MAFGGHNSTCSTHMRRFYGENRTGAGHHWARPATLRVPVLSTQGDWAGRSPGLADVAAIVGKWSQDMWLWRRVKTHDDGNNGTCGWKIFWIWNLRSNPSYDKKFILEIDLLNSCLRKPWAVINVLYWNRLKCVLFMYECSNLCRYRNVSIYTHI